MKNWEQAIFDLASSPGVVMVVGAADTGKSTFCLELLRTGFENGVVCAFVDADVGQSDLGPPCTVSMSLLSKKCDALSDLPSQKMAFVGSTSPAGHFLECVNGTKQMVDAAAGMGAELIVVNTTGLVDGYAGRKLKTHKINLIRPNYLVGLQKKTETQHLLLPFVRMNSIQVLRVKTPEQIRTKSPEYRAARRKLKFASEFAQAAGHIIKLDTVDIWGTFFRTGSPLTWQDTKALEDTINCRILHAEVSGRSIFAVTEQTCGVEINRLLEEKYPNHKITLASTTCFNNLLCGLADNNGQLMKLGLIQAVDFKRMFVYVLSQIKTVSPVSIVQMGSIRLTREGREISKLRPGEI